MCMNKIMIAMCGGSTEVLLGDWELMGKMVWWRKTFVAVWFFSFWVKNVPCSSFQSGSIFFGGVGKRTTSVCGGPAISNWILRHWDDFPNSKSRLTRIKCDPGYGKKKKFIVWFQPLFLARWRTMCAELVPSLIQLKSCDLIDHWGPGKGSQSHTNIV